MPRTADEIVAVAKPPARQRQPPAESRPSDRPEAPYAPVDAQEAHLSERTNSVETTRDSEPQAAEKRSPDALPKSDDLRDNFSE